MTRTPADLVARDFGDAFAAALEKLPVGEWAGPIDSSFGAHYVRVSDCTPAAAPTRRRARRTSCANGRTIAASARALTPMPGCAADMRSASRRIADGTAMRKLSSRWSWPWRCCSPPVVPARADEFKPGYLQLDAAGPRDLRRPLEDPRDRRVDDVQGEAAVSRGNRGADGGAQHVFAGYDGTALAHPRTGGARRQGDLICPTLRDPDRCAGAPGSTRWQRPARTHPAGPVRLHRPRQPWPIGSGENLHDARRRTHPVRLRSPVVRPGPGAVGAGNKPAVVDHHRVHGRAQPDAGRRHAWLGARARTAG